VCGKTKIITFFKWDFLSLLALTISDVNVCVWGLPGRLPFLASHISVEISEIRKSTSAWRSALLAGMWVIWFAYKGKISNFFSHLKIMHIDFKSSSIPLSAQKQFLIYRSMIYGPESVACMFYGAALMIIGFYIWWLAVLSFDFCSLFFAVE
jgi:hypothetical protein